MSQFPVVQYMHWAKAVPGRHAFNLAQSGIARLLSMQELGVCEDDVVLEGNNFDGYPELRALIAQRYGVAERNILIAQGTSLANFLVAAALLGRGDEALVEQPAYEPLLTMLAPLGVAVRRVPRRFEEGYALDPDAFARALSPRTRLIVLTSLFNPGGVAIPETTLRAVGERAARVGAAVLVDEVYRDFLGDAEPPAFLLGEPFITTNSLTKVYGLGGLRVGWAFAPEPVVRAAYDVYNNLGVNNAYPADHLARVLMASGATERLAARARERAARHWPIVRDWVAARSAWEVVRPDGGICCFVRRRDGRSARPLVERAMAAHDTAVVPGAFFEDEAGFRLGFGVEETVLREGLGRLARAIEEVPA